MLHLRPRRAGVQGVHPGGEQDHQPDYTGTAQQVAVKDFVSASIDSASSQVTTIQSGKAITLRLELTPHLTLEQGTKVQLAKDTSGTLSGNADVVVLDAGRWPLVTVAPIAQLTLANVGVADSYADGKHTVTCTNTVLIGK